MNKPIKMGNKEIVFEEKGELIKATVTGETGNVTEYYSVTGVSSDMIWYGGTLQRSRDEVAEAFKKHCDDIKFAQLKTAFEQRQ
jgi:hypothetical protein